MSFTAVLQRLQKLENPYPGLRPFEREEQHLFFGRDQQIAELVVRLERNRFVAVIGVSGGGKSSLVRAGLIPALERGSVGAAGSRWRMVVTRPAGHPFDSLAADLLKSGLNPSPLRDSSHGLVQVARQLPPEETLLVVVDQFEELFRYKDRKLFTHEDSRTRETAASEASEFVQLLLSASREQPPVYIVLTMRSDYLGDCAEFRDLPETLNTCQYLVPRLTREQRRQAIEGPLGLTAIAPSLVQRILNDAGDEPDQLPVLQHALMRTWRQWRESDPSGERAITLHDYEAQPIGGLEHALDRHAEELLGTDPEEIAIAETIFKRLTTGTRRERRNPSRLSELWEVCEADTEEQRKRVNSVIDRFRSGEATFLAPRDGPLAPETYIDITHESLIREWGRLRAWVEDEAESRATFLRIYEDAQLCEQGKGDLWRDPKLQMTLDWWEAKKPSAAWVQPFLPSGAAGDKGFETAKNFLEDSRKARQKEIAQARRRRLTTQIVAGVVTITMASVIVWGVINRRLMKTEHQKAVARALVGMAFRDQIENPSKLETTALYALESFKREPNAGTLQTLQLATGLLRKRVSHLESGGVWGLSFSPNGYLATASGHVAVHDRNWKPLADLDTDEGTWAVAFSKDGKYLATAGERVLVFETTSWKQVWMHQDLDVVEVGALAFSPDGMLLAMGTPKGRVRVWDGRTGKDVGPKRNYGHVWAVAFSPDGRDLAIGSEDGMLRLIDIQNPEKTLWTQQLSRAARAVAFSPDGRYLAVGNDDGIAVAFELSSKNEVWRWTHQGGVTALAFSPEGHRIAVGCTDGAAHVYDMASGREVLRQAHKDAVLSLAFNREGTLLASGSSDGEVDITEVSFPDEVARLPASLQKFPKQVSMTWDEKDVAVIDEGGTAQVFELPSGKPVSPPIHVAEANQVAVSSGGLSVALGGGSQVGVFESSTGKSRFSRGLDGVTSIDLTADGRYLAAATNNEVWVFDLERQTPAWKNPAVFEKSISNISFSANGRQLAVGGQMEELNVFRTETGDKALVVNFKWRPGQDCGNRDAPCKLNGIVFSRDGRYVVLSSSDKMVRVVDLALAKQICMLTLPANVVYAILSDDDRFVATASDDLKGRVYEMATSKDLWRMPLAAGDFFPLLFTSDDKYLMSVTGSREIVVERHAWRSQDVMNNACPAVARNLKQDEWKRFLTTEPLPQSCSSFP